MSRVLGLAILAGTLLFSQLAFAWHGAAHLADFEPGYDHVCLECLAIANALPAPPAVAKPSLAQAEAQPPYEGAKPARLRNVHRTYFLSRAPPFFQS